MNIAQTYASLYKTYKIYKKCAPLWLTWIITALIFWPSTRSLWDQWTGDTSGYSHGILVLGLVFYLLSHKSLAVLDALSKAAPTYRASPLLLIGSAIWAAGYLMDVQVVQWLILPGMLILSTLLVFGLRVALVTTPMLLFFYLAIPVWDYLIPHLQQLSIWATTLLLKVFQIPAEINGIDVLIPNGQFRIADGCSGLRYFLVSLTLSLLFGYMHYNTTSLQETLLRRSLLAIWAMVIGITFNWVRIFLIIYIGYRTKMASSLVEDHEMFGWILFAIALFPIFWVANKLYPIEQAEKSSERPLATTQAPQSFIPRRSQYWNKKTIIGVATLSFGPVAALLFNTIQIQPPNHYPIHIPFEIGPWSRVSQQEALATSAPITKGKPLVHQWQPQYINTDQASDIYFMHQQHHQAIHLATRFYFTQRQEAELIFYFNAAFDNDVFQQISHERINYSHGSLNKRILEPHYSQPTHKKTATQQVVVYDFYYVGGYVTPSKIKAKLLQLFAKTRGRSDGGYLGVGIHCFNRNHQVSDQQATDTCQNLDNRIIPFINSLLDEQILPLQ